jgi:hypothetical protein
MAIIRQLMTKRVRKKKHLAIYQIQPAHKSALTIEPNKGRLKNSIKLSAIRGDWTTQGSIDP